MALLSTRNIDSNGNQLRLYAEETGTNASTNMSSVHAWLDLYVVGSVASSGITVGVSGADNQNLGYRSYGAGTHRLIDGYYTALHDNQGYGTTTPSGFFNSAIGNWSLSGTLTLSKINRYPVLNSGSNFTDRTNPVYDITAYGTYNIRVKLEAGGNTSLITRNLSSKNSQKYTLVLTDAERKLLRSKSADGKTVAVTETVCALDSNNNEINWSFKNYTMTIVKKPVKVRRNGSWVNAYPYVRVNGSWKEAKPYIRVNGSWKEEK